MTSGAGPEIVLPASAIMERDGKGMVWVVDPTAKTVSTRGVTLGARDGTSVRILDGLTAGTRVVTAGVNSLASGQSVDISEGSL